MNDWAIISIKLDGQCVSVEKISGWIPIVVSTDTGYSARSHQTHRIFFMELK